MSEDDPKETPPEAAQTAGGAHVISLESRLKSGAKPMLTVPRKALCFAHHYLIDRKTRLATCTKCGESFDCFDAMVDLAEHWGDYQGNRNVIKKEIDALRQERDELKSEVDRLKSFTRRKYRAIAETSPHATRCLELVLRMSRGDDNNARWELLKLARQVEDEAKVVSIRKPESA